MRIPLMGHRIESIEVGYQFVLRTGSGTEVRVESRFTVFVTDSLKFEGVPCAELVENKVLKDLVGREIVDASSSDEGKLEITFQGGSRLVVESDPDYEAWTMASPDGAKVVAEPGGGIAVWGPI